MFSSQSVVVCKTTVISIMKRTNFVVQLVGVVFFCLSMATTGSATRKEELERAAELAVERAAELVAERAVEKALESGNSSTETETIRMSHSSVRKHDSTWQLPGFAYTPREFQEYERILQEQEAGERAVAQIKRRRLVRQAFDNEKNYLNPTSQQPIDISTFPFRSTPFRFSSDQYQYPYAQSDKKHTEVHEENKEENLNINNDYGKIIQQPLKVFQVTQKTIPTIYFLPQHVPYPIHFQYFVPQGSHG